MKSNPLFYCCFFSCLWTLLPLQNKEKTDYAQDLLFILQNALADSTGTCKTCWKYFGVISKHMRMYSKIPVSWPDGL